MRFALPLLSVLFAGCVNDPTESSADVRERYVDRHADTFVLTDRTRTIDALKTAFFEEGYELVATDTPKRFVTDVKNGYKSTTECTIHLLELIDKAMLVQIMEVTRDEAGEVTGKKQRTDLEWLVAQRSEPDRALSVMRKANERADKVPPITRKK